MTKPVETVDIDATLSDASATMRRLNTCLIPVQSGNEVIGVISDRDVAARPDGRTTVRSAMTTDFTYCFANQDASEAARIMDERRARDLLVLDEDKRVVGVVSADAIAARTRSDRVGARV
jgi:CBS domain-containing protein